MTAEDYAAEGMCCYQGDMIGSDRKLSWEYLFCVNTDTNAYVLLSGKNITSKVFIQSRRTTQHQTRAGESSIGDRCGCSGEERGLTEERRS